MENYLLTDEFVEFSQAIKELHVQKKAKADDFKVLYQAYKKEVKELDDQAEKLQAEFNDWVANQTKSSE